jgi:hypothetical protein
MRSRSSVALVACCLLTVCTADSGALAQGGRTSGAASPQEVVAAIKAATAKNDLLGVLPVISPDGLKELANESVSGLMILLAFSDPNDPMPGGTSKPKAELDAERKKYATAVELVKSTLKPYGLDTLVGKPALAADVQKSLDAAIAKADNIALISAIFNSIDKLGPLLGMNRQPKSLIDLGDVTDYKLSGDTATAQNRAETLRFVRVNGRWFIEPPGKGPGANAPPPGPAQQPAPRPTAAGKDPEIVAGGVQIARVVVPDNEYSGKPFNSDNGTKLVLWVKMPAGQGLIEIDEDESLLQSFGDDKGTNMGGKFGSFPREFKDGAGGTIEIESTGFAAAGATAIVAEGSVALTVSSGTRKIRAPKVTLQNNAKFTFEKTPIVVDQVEAQAESMVFTLKLPRRLMESIKDVAFFDAKGEPIEGSRTGSGYMNDAAEMGFTVKTAAKTLTLEFETWQGLRTIKVPFKVRAALGLN